MRDYGRLCQPWSYGLCKYELKIVRLHPYHVQHTLIIVWQWTTGAEVTNVQSIFLSYTLRNKSLRIDMYNCMTGSWLWWYGSLSPVVQSWNYRYTCHRFSIYISQFIDFRTRLYTLLWVNDKVKFQINRWITCKRYTCRFQDCSHGLDIVNLTQTGSQKGIIHV